MSLEFDADAEELQLYLAETNDHLQLLDQHIVQLEANPCDQHLLQSIFRSAHTIKGSAGMIGHTRMAGLAHAMENVLDGLRARTLTVTPNTIDALLAALDALRVLNHEVVTRETSDVSLEAIVAALEGCLTGNPAALAPADTAGATLDDGIGNLSASGDATELAALLAKLDSGCIYEVVVSVDPDCGLSAARTLQVYIELRRYARLLRASPTPAEIEADESIALLRALVVSDELPSLLEHRLSQIADVIDARVTAVERPAIALERTAPAAGVAPAPPASPAEEGPRAGAERIDKPVQPESSIRISVSILDDLMSLVSELVLGRTRLQTLRAHLHDRYRDDEQVSSLEDAVGHIEHVSNDLQAAVMKARMLPVENVFNKFPRLVRDLAAQKGKRVNFTMSGQETELDRSVIEQLSDPLIHLLRNALDHGMEAPVERLAAGKPEVGSISLAATPCENHILIEMRDDGPGIDTERTRAVAIAKGLLTREAAERLSEREAMELIFASGLSTAHAITDISGRGVGMDIVKSTIEHMGGHIRIDSELGKGTTFSITLPLTLAIMQALLVSVDNAVYALPLNVVTEIVSVPLNQVHMLQGTEATLLRGTILPLVRLRDYFKCAPAPACDVLHLVATRVDGQLLGLAVDHFIGEQEIVMKPLGTYMGAIPGLAGATILGDGRIGLLVDVTALKNGSAVPAGAAA